MNYPSDRSTDAVSGVFGVLDGDQLPVLLMTVDRSNSALTWHLYSWKYNKTIIWRKYHMWKQWYSYWLGVITKQHDHVVVFQMPARPAYNRVLETRQVSANVSRRHPPRVCVKCTSALCRVNLRCLSNVHQDVWVLLGRCSIGGELTSFGRSFEHALFWLSCGVKLFDCSARQLW